MNHQQNINLHSENAVNGDLRTAPSWDSTAVTNAMQASWFSCSVNEEDFIDNIQPNLITSLTGSLSSNFTADDTCVGVDIVPHMYCENSSNYLLRNVTRDSISNGTSSKEENLDTANDNEFIMSRPDSPKSKLSLSMHDISTIPSFPLTAKSSNFSTSTIQSQSMTTDASLPKSKDSGFPRSLSCLSLSSGRSYAHVQSKVKEYIRQIKEENENSRKADKNSRIHIEQEPLQVENESVSVKKLIPIIDKLKDELDDKDKIIMKLQENYDELLTRYAAAEQRIDHFRVKSSETRNSTPLKYTSHSKKPKAVADPNILLIPELQEILNDSHSDFAGSYASKSPKQSPGLSKSNSKVLNPITKFYSSSVRLDKLVARPAITKTDAESSGCSSFMDEHSKLCDRHTSSSLQTLINRSGLESRDRNQTSLKSTVKELSPERLNNQLAENPFIKVQRWQESLPSFEFIEPSSYSSLNTNKSESLVGSYQPCKPTDQSFSSSNYIDSAMHEGNSSTNNLCNYLLIRSISQPNYIQGDIDSQCSLYRPSQQVGASESSNLEPHMITRSLSLKVTEDSKCGTKHSQGPQPLPPVMCSRHRNLGITESSHLSRKKLVGQKARLVLFEYLKKSSFNSNLYISKSPKVLEKIQLVKTKSFSNVSEQEVNSLNGSYDDRDISLVHCLDEMNQCAQNLKGKSEAIIQVLAKQLKDP